MARNLLDLLPLAKELGPDRIAFCTDDRDPEDIADDGHMNGMVRKAVERGDRSRGRDRHGLAEPCSLPPAEATRRYRTRATGPTCSSSPTSSTSCPRRC